ncbi:MAG: FlgO family outer membrane protein [Spirochaetaceae bacterium]|nr:FlgO family outer membrane protein [Spirochaetaceae bacterium]
MHIRNITMVLLGVLVFSGCYTLLDEEFKYEARLQPLNGMDERSYLYSGDQIYPVRFMAESVMNERLKIQAAEDVIEYTFNPNISQVLIDTNIEYLKSMGVQQDPRSRLELKTRITDLESEYIGSESKRFDSLAFNTKTDRYWICRLNLEMELTNLGTGEVVWNYRYEAETTLEDPDRIMKYGGDNIANAVTQALNNISYEDLLMTIERSSGAAAATGATLVDYSKINQSDYEGVLKALAQDVLSGRNGINLAVLDIMNVDNRKSVLGSFVEEELYTNLVRSKPADITIIERSQINQIMQEWDLGSSGIVNNDTAVQIGQLVGANAVVLGSITKIGETARINIRIVDVETARVESTASATLSGADFTVMYDQYVN